MLCLCLCLVFSRQHLVIRAVLRVVGGDSSSPYPGWRLSCGDYTEGVSLEEWARKESGAEGGGGTHTHTKLCTWGHYGQVASQACLVEDDEAGCCGGVRCVLFCLGYVVGEGRKIKTEVKVLGCSLWSSGGREGEDEVDRRRRPKEVDGT